MLSTMNLCLLLSSQCSQDYILKEKDNNNPPELTLPLLNLPSPLLRLLCLPLNLKTNQSTKKRVQNYSKQWTQTPKKNKNNKKFQKSLLWSKKKLLKIAKLLTVRKESQLKYNNLKTIIKGPRVPKSSNNLTMWL